MDCSVTVPNSPSPSPNRRFPKWLFLFEKPTRAPNPPWVYAWPIAESGVMGAQTTVEVFFRDEIRSAKDPEAFFCEKVAEFQKTASPYAMVHSIFIDDIIEPAETRDRLIATLEVFLSKRRILRDKTRHGNIPL